MNLLRLLDGNGFQFRASIESVEDSMQCDVSQCYQLSLLWPRLYHFVDSGFSVILSRVNEAGPGPVAPIAV